MREMPFPEGGYIVFDLPHGREYVCPYQPGLRIEAAHDLPIISLSYEGEIWAQFNLGKLNYWHWRAEPPEWYRKKHPKREEDPKPEEEEPKDE